MRSLEQCEQSAKQEWEELETDTGIQEPIQRLDSKSYDLQSEIRGDKDAYRIAF